jgi:hypothetical protein
MLHPVQVCEPIPSRDLTAAPAPPRTDSRSREGVQTPPPILHPQPLTWYQLGTGCIVLYVRSVQRRGRMGRMGRVRTHMALVSSGWGPSGRRFKSGLPDSSEPASEALVWPRRGIRNARFSCVGVRDPGLGVEAPRLRPARVGLIGSLVEDQVVRHHAAGAVEPAQRSGCRSDRYSAGSGAVVTAPTMLARLSLTRSFGRG